MTTDFLTSNWPLPPTRKMRGQWYFRAPGHPLAGRARKSGFYGWVRACRHIASIKVGHWLERHELVQFLDGNLDNLDPGNLVVIERSDFQRIVSNKSAKVSLTCPVCGSTFTAPASHAQSRTTCSPECLSKLIRRFEVTPRELFDLVWEQSTIKLSKTYGVSDKAIGKRCQKFGIPKPPRGYWRLVELGASHEQALLHLKWTTKQIEALDTLGDSLLSNP